LHRVLSSIDIGPQPFRWTREDYDRLADVGLFHNRRVQLIDGEIIEMSPHGNSHAMLIPVIYEVLKSAFGAGFTIRPQLPLALGKESAPEPDLAVVRGNPREHVVHPNSAVLVVEISDSSLAFDAGMKAALYARAGINEYWIVNLIHSQLDVYRKPVIGDKFEFGAGYGQRWSLTRDETVSPMAAPKAVIRAGELLP
jgi:Uma2 family endonuclease